MHFSPPLRKTFMAIIGSILLLVILGFSGCDSTPAERIAAVKKMVSQTATVSQTVDVAIAELEKIIADSQAALQDPNIPADMKLDIEKVLADTSAKLAELKSEKQKATAIITRWQIFLEQVDPDNLTPDQELQLYATGAGDVAQYLPAKYRGYVFLGLALVPLIGSILKNINQWRQINDDKRKTTEIVISVDELLKSELVTDVKAAKQLLASKQPTASLLVDAIHDPLKNTGPSK